VGPAAISQVANLELDVLGSEGAALVHVFLLDGLFLLLFQLDLLQVVLLAAVVVIQFNLRISILQVIPLGRIIILLEQIVRICGYAHLLMPLVVHVRGKTWQTERARLLRLIKTFNLYGGMLLRHVKWI
jgi:hypothetical protein